MKKVLVIDFGGQTCQLIAKFVRSQNIYCEVYSWHSSFEKISAYEPDALILSGGNNSAYADNSPFVDHRIYDMGIPILGICYGMQFTAQALGGKVAQCAVGEFGKTQIITKSSKLYKGLPRKINVWMSHYDSVVELPKGFEITSYSNDCAVASFQNVERQIYGIQYHAEVFNCEHGSDILSNFLHVVCGITGDWSLHNFIGDTIEAIRAKVGDGKVLCAMSGGVDSAVAATLVNKAIGDQLVCVYVDHGLMRKNETDEIIRVFKEERGMNLIVVNAEEHFLDKLRGVTEPERKRKIIGEEFIRIFEREAKKIGNIDYLVQGTIYPDVIESGSSGSGEVIKSHHNVGGLPELMDFKGIIEPLRTLFKDEVRNVGLTLGLPSQIVMRQPFPGPGLAIRVIGELTKDRLDILRDADFILREEIAKAHLDESIWQYFAVLTPVHSVGVMGDKRTYGNLVALRAVNSVDAMTSDWARIPYEVLDTISRRITNEVKDVNRVVYDITSKPPATIEWE